MREVPRYDPRLDAAERHPDWTIRFSNLCGIAALMYSASRRIVLLDTGKWWGRETEALAMVVAHLDEGDFGDDGGLTRAQTEKARWLAQIRLDTEQARVLLTRT